MKSALSLILLFSFLIVNLSKSLIFVDYQINKVEITAKFCVNKDKPNMHCCGKCLLKKKLAEQEAQQNFPAFPDIKTDIQLYSSESSIASYSSEYNQIELISTNHILHTLFEGTSVFHPPSC